MGWKDSFQASGKTGSAQPEAVLNAEGGWKKSFQQDSVRRGDLAASSQMAEEARQKQENQQKGFFQNLGEGLTLGAKQRVLGLAQASNDLLGWASPETAQDMNGLARNYQARGRGTGTGGLIGEILGDPLTAATLPIAGTGSVGGLALQGAGIGAAGGATAPMENSNLPDRLTGMGLSAAIGGVGGAAIPVAGKVVRKAAKPFTAVDGELGRLAGVMEQEGVALTPAQKTGSKVLRGVETGFAELPFTSGAQAKVTDAQQKAFNAAVLKRAGIAADSATPDVLDAGKRAISKQFEDIAARTTLNVDDALLNRLAAVEKEAAKRLGKDEARAVQSFIDDVLSSGGKIDGRTYQNTRSMLGQMAQGGKDSFKSGLLKDMQSALDDAAFRSLSPADQAAWLQARTQYGAYKTIEKAMSSTGNNTLAGNISPAALASAAKTANKNYATGAGALNDLARGGAAFLRDPVGNSGTGQRLLWQGLLSGTGVAGYATGGVPGAVASMAAPKGLQAIYNTGPVQRYLTQAAGKAAPAVGPLSKAAAAAAALGGAAAAEE